MRSQNPRNGIFYCRKRNHSSLFFKNKYIKLISIPKKSKKNISIQHFKQMASTNTPTSISLTEFLFHVFQIQTSQFQNFQQMNQQQQIQFLKQNKTTQVYYDKIDPKDSVILLPNFNFLFPNLPATNNLFLFENPGDGTIQATSTPYGKCINSYSQPSKFLIHFFRIIKNANNINILNNVFPK